MTTQVPEAVRAAYGLEAAVISAVPVGLINRTFFADLPDRRLVIQRVNPIFTPRVHEDIDAITRHLEAQGLLTPRLVATRAGALYVEQGGEVWRALSYVEGVTFERLTTPAQAEAAGELLGRFHRALAGLAYEFKNRRLGVHDTARHLAVLARALEEKRDHPRYALVAPLGRDILEEAQQLPPLPATPERVVHGDPKISNLLFDAATGRGRALVDLDTLARMPLPLELGDAFRSWCNPSGEDETRPRFSLPLFAAAVRGYAEATRGFLLPEEQGALVGGARLIMVELAARFGADALNESYFGWDQARFASASAHNELRARGQLALARSLAEVQPEAEALARRAFA